MLAVGTLLALAGLSAVGHPAQAGQRPPAVAANSGTDRLRTPVYVPRGHTEVWPVALDKLAGPEPVAPMGYSVPVHVALPQAGIDFDVTPVGLGARAAPGVLALRNPRQAAWYDLGPAPGQLGIAVLDAHVPARASYAIRPGDTIRVTRADHSLAVFTVDATEHVASGRGAAGQPRFSGAAPYAALSLVTCSGSLDTWHHGCLDHTIVRAHLTSDRPMAVSDRAY